MTKQELNLLKFATGTMTQTGTRATKIVWREFQKTKRLLGHMPNDTAAYAEPCIAVWIAWFNCSGANDFRTLTRHTKSVGLSTIFFGVVHGEENELDLRQETTNLADSLNAVQFGHRNVGNNNVGPQSKGCLKPSSRCRQPAQKSGL